MPFPTVSFSSSLLPILLLVPHTFALDPLSSFLELESVTNSLRSSIVPFTGMEGGGGGGGSGCLEREEEKIDSMNCLSALSLSF